MGDSIAPESNMHYLHDNMHVVQIRSSALLPILRSQTQGVLLAWLYLHPGEEFTVGELAGHTGSDVSAVSREASRFAESGFVMERRQGNLRFLRANVDSIIADPLARLLMVTYGPMTVVSEALESVDGIDQAYIYGSWAARYRGEPGPIPHDIDVLVVGDADEDDLFEAARRCESRLGREVNVHQTSSDRWEQAVNDPFLETVRSRPLLRLDIESQR